jgi:uncharacterized membrane protein YccC
MRPTLPTASEWLYSGKAFLAAILAFYIALRIPLPNPYWSFASVYIVSHPLSGATRSKSVYRAFGTVLGAAMAVCLVSLFASSPITLVLAMGTWSAFALYLSLRDNTPSAYGFLLSSYTTPLIAVSAIIAPGTVFDTAVARTEEILLGIVCASVVSTVLLPDRVGPVFHERLAALMKDASAWAVRRLTDPSRRTTPPLRFNLLSDIASLDALITHLGHDATRRNEASEARQVRFRMTMLIPQVASLADALTFVADSKGAAAHTCDALLADVITWLRQGVEGAPAMGDALRERIAVLREEQGAPSAATLPVANATERLRDLVDLWQDCLMLHHAFVDKLPMTPTLAYRDAVPDASRRFYDHVMMLHAALSPALAFVISALAWLHSGWPGGAAGVVLVAVSTAFFAASDAPAALVGRFLLWQVISVAAGLVYLFYIFPQVTTFTGVALSLAPPLLLVGTLTGRPAFNMGVLLVTSQTISGIALHNNSAANFEDYANSSLAALGGLAFAAVWTAATRPFGAQIGARRLALANWREQMALSRRELRIDRKAALSRIVDRTAQWMPRLALTTGQPLSHMDAVRDLRVSVALIDLREHSARGVRPIDAVLEASQRYFRACLDARTSLVPPHGLLAAIDAAMADLASEPGDAAAALLRYRLSLLALPPAAQPDTQPLSPTLSSLPQ